MDSIGLEELFESAALKGDYDLLSRAVDALASVTGTVDLSKEDTEANGTIGERLADHVGKTSDAALALRLKLAPQFHKLVLNDTASQRILSMLLAYLAVRDDWALFEELERFVPSDIRNPALAYNLACAAARRGDTDGVIKYATVALELGKHPKQFRDDGDFKHYLSDSKFAALLDGTIGPLVSLRRKQAGMRRLNAAKFAVRRALSILPSLYEFALGLVCMAVFLPVLAWVDYKVQLSELAFVQLLKVNALFGVVAAFVAAFGIKINARCGYRKPITAACFLIGFGLLCILKSQLISHFMIDFSYPLLMAAIAPLIPVAAAAVGCAILGVLLKGTFHH